MFRRPPHIVAAIAVAAFVLVVANAIYSIRRDYDGTLAEHEAMARDLASVVAAQAARSVADADLALAHIGEIARSGGGLGIFRSRDGWTSLQRIAQRIPGAAGVLVAAPDGTVVASSLAQPTPPASVGDRDYVAVLRDRDILYVGAAVRSRLDDRSVIYTINRRITDADGRLMGIVSAGVDTRHLTEFYDLLGFKKDPGIAVFRDNGDIIARRPDIREFIGRNIGGRPLFRVRLKQAPEGVFRGRSPMDAIDRLNAYKRVADTGLVVLVGIPWETVTGDWLARTERVVLIAALSGIAIFAAALWGSASLRRVMAAERLSAGEQVARQRMRTFVDMATHEFKTPLAVIDSSAQMLERLVESGQDGVGPRLTLIRDSVRKIAGLMDTCLAGSRIDRDYPLGLAAFDPAALVRRVIERQCADGTLVVADVGELPGECIADPELLTIALDALIDNARRYGPAGAPIEVTARRQGTSIAVAVCDRGPGIPEEETARVFEKYYRGTRVADIPGTGIGLDLVRTIADLHHGSIAYRPREGGGAAFTLTVPLAQDHP